MKKCSEVMSVDPITALPSDTADHIAILMKSENVGPIPIVDSQQNRKLLGIVTDRDLAVKIVAEGRDPKQTRIEDVMTRDPVTVHPDDDMQKALRAMEVHQVRRLPVVDSQGVIVGIIAQADLAMRLDQPKKTAEVVEAISHPA